MIPLRDANPSSTTPFVTYILIVLNVAVFVFEPKVDIHFQQFVLAYGLVPARFFNDIHTAQVTLSTIFPFFTSMFLHGGWEHLLGNMWFLYIFGDNVEDRFGHTKYSAFYIIAGLAAALTQAFVNPTSIAPMVGASGAIAGVLGAYIVMFPQAKVSTFFFFRVVDFPAYVFLGFWFVMQAISGGMSLGIGADAGGVAWWAHIGGFAAGAVSVPLLKKSG